MSSDVHQRALAVMRQALIDAGLPLSLLTEMVADRKRLRDEFAIAALQAMVGSEIDPRAFDDWHSGEKLGEYMARKAYAMADFMLNQREVSNG